MAERTFHWPDGFFERIERELKALGHSFETPQKLAPWVLELSDHYTKERSQIKDIWANSHWAAAYLAYFFPLNYLRASAVATEGARISFFKGLQSVSDLGSGPGTLHHVWQDLALGEVTHRALETSPVARKLHQNLLGPGAKTVDFVNRLDSRPQASELIMASYSINEMNEPPEALYSTQALMLIEPSLRDTARKLLELRQKFLNRGFHAWAPCPHQKACPLLNQSKTDWCHDRVFVGKAEWFTRLEAHLPMKNQSVTFSYLLLRKDPPPAQSQKIRLIGDTLYEKGKIRQMACLDERRLFLSWLRKQGDPPRIERGELLDYPSDCEIKGNEIRLSVGRE